MRVRGRKPRLSSFQNRFLIVLAGPFLITAKLLDDGTFNMRVGDDVRGAVG